MPEETHAAQLEEALTAGWDTEEDVNEEDLQDSYPEGAPSLLASKYLAAQGRNRLILGSTRRSGLTAHEAFQVSLCQRCLETLAYYFRIGNESAA